MPWLRLALPDTVNEVGTLQPSRVYDRELQLSRFHVVELSHERQHHSHRTARAHNFFNRSHLCSMDTSDMC
jgi:hypothetical protein